MFLWYIFISQRTSAKLRKHRDFSRQIGILCININKAKKSLNKLLKAKPSMRSCLHEHFPSSGVREGLEKPTKNFGMQWDREENIIHFFLQSGHSILLSAHMRGRILAVWLLLELKINLPRGNERQQVSLVY